MTGEPVECLYEGGWWEGFVHCTYDDHITVFFPGAHAQQPMFAGSQANLPGGLCLKSVDLAACE